jgi:hypothetical protein
MMGHWNTPVLSYWEIPSRHLGNRAVCSSSVAVSAVARCDHLVSEVRTWLAKVVTLSALWSAALYVTDVATVVAVSAALPAAAAAHPGAAPP